MTQPLKMDPEQWAMVEALMEKVAAKAKGESGRKDMLFREVWAEYARNKLSIAPGTQGARRDITTIWSHEPVLLGDPIKDKDGKVIWPGVEFEWEGKMVRLGDMPSLEITAVVAQRFAQALVTTPRRDGKAGPTGPGYRNRVITTLQSVLSWKWGRGRHSLANYKKEDVSECNREGLLTPEQVDTICDHGHADLADVIRVSDDFGCLRRGEVAMLQHHMVNWKDGTVTIPGYMLKGGKGGTFPLSDSSLAILRRRKEAGRRGNVYFFQDPRAGVGGDCGCEVRFRYKHEEGHLGLWKISDMFRQAAEAGKVYVGEGAKRRLAIHHDLRRKAVTDIIANTGDLEAAMSFGRWNSVKVVRGYIQRSAERMAKFREVTNRLRSGQPTAPAPAPEVPAERAPARRVPRKLANAGRARRRPRK